MTNKQLVIELYVYSPFISTLLVHGMLPGPLETSSEVCSQQDLDRARQRGGAEIVFFLVTKKGGMSWGDHSIVHGVDMGSIWDSYGIF